MTSNPKDESFRVIDRRLFNERGELRQDIVAELDADQKKNQPAAANSPAAASSAPRAQAPDTPAVTPEPPQTLPAFLSLIDFLYQNAAFVLGAPDPRTGQSLLDLESARMIIDMLDAVRTKARGSLSQEEERLLTDRLGRLQMTFVEMRNAAARAARNQSERKS